LETEQVICSQDALWLNQQYGAWRGITKQSTTNINDDDNDELFTDTDPGKARDIKAGRETETNVDRIEIVDNNDNPVPPKLARAMQKLGGFFNPEAQTITDRVRATAKLATTPTADPINQSIRKGGYSQYFD
jgi:hypothetical protein